MLALIASGVVIAYLLIPGALYRILFSLFIPPKNFQRTRADDVRFAILAGVVPLGLAIFLVFEVGWTAHHPFPFPGDSLAQRQADYRSMFGGAYSEKLFDIDPSRFWHSLNHVLRRQARILSWYYLILVLEAIGLGSCSRKLWWFTRDSNMGASVWNRLVRWCSHTFADQVLVPQISEWYLLLSTAAFAPDGARRVQVDVLLDNDMLCRGTVANGSYFLSSNGGLSGVMLTDASRFERRRYLNDEATGMGPKPDNYWRVIPGARLYIPFNRVLNFNVRYEPTVPDFLKRRIQRILSGRGIKASVTEKKEPAVP